MRDFKYLALLQGAPGWPNLAAASKHSYLLPWLEIFNAGLKRTYSLSAMPMMIASHTTLHQLFLANANFDVTGRGRITTQELFDLNFPEKIFPLISQQITELVNLPENALDRLTTTLGVRHIEQELLSNNGMRDSMDAILASVVFESWIAFESLASDLWVTAVDKGPKSLANKIALSNEFEKGEPITIKEMRTLEYDARAELGRFLRETRRVSFQTLEKIKLAYKIAFGKQVVTLFDETNGGYITALAAFRNIFAHKLGRADRHFETQVQKFPEYRQFQRDAVIPLDGEIVSTLRNASYTMAVALILHVDDAIDQMQ